MRQISRFVWQSFGYVPFVQKILGNVFLLSLVIFCLQPGESFGQAAEKATGQAADILKMASGDTRVSLTEHMDVLWDKGRGWNIQDVSGEKISSEFHPVSDSSLYFESDVNSAWLRFSVDWSGFRGKRNETDTWLVDLGWPFFHEAKLYWLDENGWQVKTAGLIHTWNLDFGLEKSIALTLPGRHVSEYYIKLTMPKPIPFQIELTTLNSFYRRSLLGNMALGFFYGVLVTMLVYNLAMWVSLRQIAYLWYVLSGLLLGVYFSGFNGLAYRFWPQIQGPWFYPPYLLAWLAGSGIFLILFARSFLFSKAHSFWADWLLKLSTIGWGVGLLMTVFASPALTVKYFSIWGMLFSIVVFVAAFTFWVKGFKPALLFLIAWTCSCIGGVALSLTLAGIIPFTTLGFYGLQIGSALEMVLFSLALAQRVRLLREEKDLVKMDRRRFRRLSDTDELTGLYNRRWLINALERQVKAFENQESQFSLAMLDIDFFKSVNDTHGHDAGDVVLRGLAEMMKTCIRKQDSACRFGGEEFTILFSGTTPEEAFEIAERLRTRLSGHKFEFDKNHSTQVTISIGLATLKPGESAGALLKRADHSLYQAKSDGRNLTRVFSFAA